MTPEDDPNGAMRHDDLDAELADRLFGGQLDPADAPESVAGLVALVRAAGGPPTSDEMAGERATVEAMAATQDASGVSPVGRKPVLVRAAHTRAAAVVALAVLGVGAAAAAVAANRSDERVGTRAPTTDPTEPIVVTVPTTVPESTTTTSTTTTTSSTTTAPTTLPPTTTATQEAEAAAAVGPDASGPAAFGLCVAWTAQGGQVDPDAVAFRNLDTAAATAGLTTADYCAQVIEDGPPPAGRPRLGQQDETDHGPPPDVPGATAPGRQGAGEQDNQREPGHGDDGSGPPAVVPGPPAGIPGGRP